MISSNEAKPSGRLQNGFFLWKLILLEYGELAKHSMRSWDGAELREVTEATENQQRRRIIVRLAIVDG